MRARPDVAVALAVRCDGRLPPDRDGAAPRARDSEPGGARSRSMTRAAGTICAPIRSVDGASNITGEAAIRRRSESSIWAAQAQPTRGHATEMEARENKSSSESLNDLAHCIGLLSFKIMFLFCCAALQAMSVRLAPRCGLYAAELFLLALYSPSNTLPVGLCGAKSKWRAKE